MLFAAYAATLGIDAAGGSDYAGAESHVLLAADPWHADGHLEVVAVEPWTVLLGVERLRG